MRIFVIFLVALLTLSSVSLAQEVTTDSAGAQIGKIRAGTTPDSFLYGLDLAIDNIRYLLTFDNTAKGKVGLEIARERLLEVREMVIENKIEASKKAQNEHVKTLERVKASVTALSRANSTEELEHEIELERELEEHEEEVETVSEELKIKIKVKGEVTPEQQALIDSVLNLMQNKTGEVKIKIENKKGETKIKIKAETGKSEEDVEKEVSKVEVKSGLLALKQEKAEEKIEDATEELSEVKSKLLELNITNITAVNELISQAETHLAKAEDAFNQSKFGEAFGQANAAEQLAKNAEKILERTSELEEEKEEKKIEKKEKETEVEIEVEIGKRITKVKVNIDGNKLKYTLQTTNENEILEDIASRTGLSLEKVKSLVEIEKATVEIGSGVEKVGSTLEEIDRSLG